MSLDKTDTRYWHEVYEQLPDKEREAIDNAYHAANDSLLEDGVKTAGDDRAEMLVAAITRFYAESVYADADKPGEAAAYAGRVERGEAVT